MGFNCCEELREAWALPLPLSSGGICKNKSHKAPHHSTTHLTKSTGHLYDMLLEAAIPTALWTPKPQHRARQHWGHLREACSAQRQKAAGSKSEKQFCGTEFRAAGQELPVACGKPMPVGSAGRTTAVESTQKQRRSMSQMENRVSAMDYFPYIVRFVCKK